MQRSSHTTSCTACIALLRSSVTGAATVLCLGTPLSHQALQWHAHKARPSLSLFCRSLKGNAPQFLAGPISGRIYRKRQRCSCKEEHETGSQHSFRPTLQAKCRWWHPRPSLSSCLCVGLSPPRRQLRRRRRLRCSCRSGSAARLRTWGQAPTWCSILCRRPLPGEGHNVLHLSWRPAMRPASCGS